MGRLVDIGDTRLYVDERGADDAFPLLVFHGGPGLDHHEFGDYLDPLADDGRYRLVLVDERGQGQSDRSGPPETWTLEQMAEDVSLLADALGIRERYATFGHSYGAFVTLLHAVRHPGEPRGSILCGGVANVKWLHGVEAALASYEPVELREQVAQSWAREESVQTEEDAERLWVEQMPFHFKEPRGDIIEDYARRSSGGRYAPDVLRLFATSDYGGIDVLDRLPQVSHPMLVLSGRYDRVCPAAAGEEMAAALPDAELVVFEESAHMMFAEEPERFLSVVRRFLDRVSNG